MQPKHPTNCVAGALKSLDELSEERGNLEKAFRWEWDNDEVLKGRTPPGVNPNQMFRDGLKRYVRSFTWSPYACAGKIDKTTENDAR